jgi:hypothetical protein
MKTFDSDKPILRYILLSVGILMASFTGTISALLLFFVIFKR